MPNVTTKYDNRVSQRKPHTACKCITLPVRARLCSSAVLISELPELAALERIVELGGHHVQSRVAARVPMGSATTYPLHVVTMGNPDPAVPAVGYFGGVHGLERIGAEVVIAYLQSLVMRLQWGQHPAQATGIGAPGFHAHC